MDVTECDPTVIGRCQLRVSSRCEEKSEGKTVLVFEVLILPKIFVSFLYFLISRFNSNLSKEARKTLSLHSYCELWSES